MNPATGNVAPVHFVNVAAVKNDVYLYDEIGTAENYIDLVQALNEATELDIFHIHVATGGGDLDGCIAIIHALRSTKAHTVGYSDAIVASAGTIIFLACKQWVINEFSYFMFHDGGGVQAGKFNETEKQILAIRRLYRSIADRIYKPFFSEEEIVAIMDGKDVYETAEMMVDRINRAFPDSAELDGEDPEDGIISPVQQLNEDLINFDSLPSEDEIIDQSNDVPQEYFSEEVAVPQHFDEAEELTKPEVFEVLDEPTKPVKAKQPKR